MTDEIGAQEFLSSEGVEDWRILSDGAYAYAPTRSFAESVELVQAISQIPGLEDHPPEVDVRPAGVTFRLITITSSYFGMSRRDVEIAAAISAVLRDRGLALDPSKLQSLLVVPGATDTAKVMAFWQAVLGYERRPDTPDEDLIDPHRRGPLFWFERMDAPRPDGGGAIHVAIWLPPEEARQRVEAALAAGGRMVRDEFAPAWWTLADAAGNEADIGTIEGRG